MCNSKALQNLEAFSSIMPCIQWVTGPFVLHSLGICPGIFPIPPCHHNTVLLQTVVLIFCLSSLILV